MHLGRERPPPTGPWGEEGGMAEGVAHAPDASFAAADSRADCDTGGTERRPLHRGEVLTAKDIGKSTLPSTQVDSAAGICTRAVREQEGERCSRVCVPPSFSSLSRILTASRGERAASEARSRHARDCAARPPEPRRNRPVKRDARGAPDRGPRKRGTAELLR